MSGRHRSERISYQLAPYMWRDYVHGIHVWIGHGDHENLDVRINPRGHVTDAYLCGLPRMTGHRLCVRFRFWPSCRPCGSCSFAICLRLFPRDKDGRARFRIVQPLKRIKGAYSMGFLTEVMFSIPKVTFRARGPG